MRRATECFSMNSDMSMRTIASSVSNRKFASALVSSVLPTPVGPRNRNEPIGRFGSESPARERRIAINPLAQLPAKTLLHELGHVILGHTTEAEFADADTTPRSLREVEAESVALLCCESLGLEGAEFCRGYIQNWVRRGNGFDAEAIPEKSAQKIFRAADQIIRAGRPEIDPITA